MNAMPETVTALAAHPSLPYFAAISPTGVQVAPPKPPTTFSV
jgi:hypothetical protein